MVIRAIPKSAITRERTGHTIFLQSKSTGLMEGRKYVKDNRKSDNTGTLRLNRDIDLNGDKKPDKFDGQIVGRTPIYVKANKRQRAYRR